MRSLVVTLTAFAAVVAIASPAHAFCGFYVAKADSKLFNKASQVIVVHDGDRNVMTMANDYEGKVKDFAMVIPVPSKLEKEQVHIGENATVDHVDAYTVGEYDILILSAKQSDGLITWLTQEGYKLPDGAEPVVDSYLKQKMHWFVAKVNLAEHDKLGGGKLRPIQVAYESPKFMLPIRLGTVNANGTQDILVYLFTRNGRVEVTNYKTVKLPTDVNVPEYTQSVFGDFYKSLFGRVVDKNDMHAVVTEYAWNLAVSCDPCSADPIVPELKSLGVWWLPNIEDYHAWAGGVGYVTRLHARYDRDHFPEDLVFQETQDKSNFQGRYVINHPFQGDMSCEEAGPYKKKVWERQQDEAKNLAELTGWKIDDVKKRMNLADTAPVVKGSKWYEKLWK